MWGWQCAFTCHVGITHASERLEKVWTRYIVFFTLWPTVDWSNAWFLLHWVTLILYPDPDWCQSQQVKDCRLPSGAMDNRKMSVEMRLLLLLLARCWTAAQQTSLYSARWRWLVSQRSQSNLLLKRWRQAVHALPRGDHVSPTTPSFANFLLTLTVMIQCCWLLTRQVELWAVQGSHGLISEFPVSLLFFLTSHHSHLFGRDLDCRVYFTSYPLHLIAHQVTRQEEAQPSLL